MVEHAAVNRGVVSSSLTGAAKKRRHSKECFRFFTYANQRTLLGESSVMQKSKIRISYQFVGCCSVAIAPYESLRSSRKKRCSDECFFFLFFRQSILLNALCLLWGEIRINESSEDLFCKNRRRVVGFG